MSSVEPKKSSAQRKRSRKDNEHVNDGAKKSKIDTEPLQLTDINDNCLMKIFNFLGLQDLVNIAETDNRFVNAAVLAFSSRVRRPLDEVFIGQNNLHLLRNDFDCVSQKDSKAFLQHFGHLTLNLAINFEGFSEDVDFLKSLQEKCSESLNKLTIVNSSEHSFGAIDAQLSNVRKLEIANSFLGEKMCQLNTWFPNLKHMKLLDTNFTHPQSLEGNFPNLTTLYIEDWGLKLPETTINEMLRLNPQLKFLSFWRDYDMSFLRSMNQSLPQLEVLLLCPPEDCFDNFGDTRVHFKNVKHFELTLPLDKSIPNAIRNMPFRFSNLKQLNLRGFERLNRLLPFIYECSSIVDLTLVGWPGYISIHDLTEIMDKMPNLVVLRFCVHDLVYHFLEGGIDDEMENGVEYAMLDVILDVTVLLYENTTLQKVHLLFENSAYRWKCFGIVKDGLRTRFDVTMINYSPGYNMRSIYGILLKRKNS